MWFRGVNFSHRMCLYVQCTPHNTSTNDYLHRFVLHRKVGPFSQFTELSINQDKRVYVSYK